MFEALKFYGVCLLIILGTLLSLVKECFF